MADLYLDVKGEKMNAIYFVYSLSCIIMVWCWPKLRAETGRCVIIISIEVC